MLLSDTCTTWFRTKLQIHICVREYQYIVWGWRNGWMVLGSNFLRVNGYFPRIKSASTGAMGASSVSQLCKRTHGHSDLRKALFSSSDLNSECPRRWGPWRAAWCRPRPRGRPRVARQCPASGSSSPPKLNMLVRNASKLYLHTYDYNMFVCLYIYCKNVHIYRVTTSSTNVLLFLIDIILNAVEKKYVIITRYNLQVFHNR